MPPEVAEAVETPAQVQAAAVEADEAFSAGFGEAPEQSATQTDPAENAATGEKDQTTKTSEEPAAAKPPQLIAGMSEEEWNAAVAKAASPLVEQARAEVRKNFGQIGEVKRALKEIGDRISAGGSPASRKRLTAEALKRVNENFDPSLGEALAADLAEFLDSPAVAAEAAQAQANAESKGQTFDPEAFFTTKIGPALEQLEARANERAELRIVKSIHRDFDQVVQSPEFGTWLGTLPAEEQQRIRESEDGFVAADAVSSFKAHREAQAKGKARNQSRLAAAVTPSGDRQPVSHVNNDEEAAFDAGFKSVK